MSILIFVVVLVVLIVVHEAGHFFAAKAAGIRVEEFGLGYPPRALVLWEKGETIYTLNWLPFGGFVKIYGEDGEGVSPQRYPGRAFTDKNRFLQACVLAAGIVMNLLFAYVLITITLAIGTPRALTDVEAAHVQDAQLTIAQVVPNSPAAQAGLMEGDVIKQAIIKGVTRTGAGAEAFTNFVANDAADVPVTLDLIRNGKEILISAIPQPGIVQGNASRRALGTAVVAVGTQAESWYQAPIDGAVLTWEIIKEIAAGLVHFFAGVFTFSADLSQVSGPVGIAGAVGTAANTGFAALLTITALISINLALINIIPIPALDGGRLFFVLVETIVRRRIKPSVAQAVNGIGFALLVLLMIVITAHDVFKIVT